MHCHCKRTNHERSSRLPQGGQCIGCAGLLVLPDSLGHLMDVHLNAAEPCNARVSSNHFAWAFERLLLRILNCADAEPQQAHRRVHAA